MDLATGFSTAGMFLVVVAGVLAFFLPFYVIGIYNESKKTNKNLQTMSSLLADVLDKGSRSSEKRIS
jgi:hypothetical protein|tara:strand:+ start:218 stop:418 length:201 start_codon:yes stop_codon:yes gene_type:complete